MATLVELEVEENENTDDAEIRTFLGLGKPVPLEKVVYYPDEGDGFEVEIKGWEEGEPSQAYALLVEDSGDGQAWLVYGGNHGIRMRKPAGTGAEFSVSNKEEWGESYLYYAFGLYDEAIKPYIIEETIEEA